MPKLVEAMGAVHIDRPKLISIVNQMEAKFMQVGPGMSFRKEPSLERVMQYVGNQQRRFIEIYDQYDYVAEQKYDGFSYLCDNGRFFSRKLSEAKGNEGQPIEKTSHVPHLHMVLDLVSKYCDFDVHGELVTDVGTGNSDGVTRIMGCTAEEAVRRQQESGALHYVLHDIRRFMGKSVVNEPYYIRRALLEQFYYTYIMMCNGASHIHISQVILDPRVGFYNIVAHGGEGLVIKKTSGLYVPGKKPAGVWIKVKKEVTFDAVVIGYNPGTGKNADKFGSLQFGMYVDGKMTNMGNVSSGIDDATRAQVANDPDGFIGQVIELSAMQENGTSFRHPVFKRFRIDKNAAECIPENVRDNLELI